MLTVGLKDWSWLEVNAIGLGVRCGRAVWAWARACTMANHKHRAAHGVSVAPVVEHGQGVMEGPGMEEAIRNRKLEYQCDIIDLIMS